MSLMKWARRNRGEAVIFSIGAVMLLGNLDGIKTAIAQRAAQRAIVQANNQAIQSVEITQEKTTKLADLARQRFESGCLLVVSSVKPEQFTTLTEGQPVMDPSRNVPVGVGVPVCAADGTTGVIEPDSSGRPVVGKLAFTGDRSVVEAAIKRQQVNAAPVRPTL